MRQAREVRLGSRLRRDVSLLPVLTGRELRSRYRHSVLDIAWALITPVLILAVYGLILTQSFSVESACGPYLSSAWIGLVVWTFFAGSVGNGVSSLVSSADLITKVYFPREAIPLASVGASLLDLAVGVASIAVLLPIQGVAITPMWLWAVPAVAVVVVWSAAIAMLTAVLAVFSRDLIHGVNLLLRVGFFATPVVYESDLLPAAFAWTATLNPVAVSIDSLRAALLCADRPDLGLLAAHLVVGAAAFVGIIAYVRAVESRVVDAS